VIYQKGRDAVRRERPLAHLLVGDKRKAPPSSGKEKGYEIRAPRERGRLPAFSLL